MTRGLAQDVSLRAEPATRKAMLSHLDQLYAWGQKNESNSFTPSLAQGVTRSQGRVADVITPLDPGAPTKVIAVVCSGNLAAYRDQIKEKLSQGVRENPSAVWVCLEQKSDRLTLGIFQSLDIDPVVLPLVPFWKEPIDNRRLWRDGEILNLCDEVIVFIHAGSDSAWRAKHESPLHENLYLMELGRPKAKRKAAWQLSL